MQVNDWIKGLIASDKVAAVPVMTHPGVELTGRRVRDAVTDGRVHFEAVRALAERYPDVAALTAIMDLTVEAEAFGAELHMSDNEVPSVAARLVADYAGVEALAVPPLGSGRVGEYLEANRLAAERIGKPVFGGCIGPFSLAGRLFGMTESMMAIYTEPDTVRLLLEKCTTFIASYCAAIKSTGAAGVILAEPAAGLLSDGDCLSWSSHHVKRIVDSVQDETFAVILHNCGNTGHCTGAMVAAGAAGYHFGNRAVMAEQFAVCPPDSLVMGNLDPVGIFKQSSAEAVYDATLRLLEGCRDHRNFVVSTGCDTPPEVPFENIDAFYAAVRRFNDGN